MTRPATDAVGILPAFMGVSLPDASKPSLATAAAAMRGATNIHQLRE
ncbi:MAG TPA: hypothetical protein VKK19_05950 [Candidatus Dormibacteraeota bacterium]|nr:hypothetical protein [Candidatus Dormibacteraeota bacterium]